MSPAAFFLSLLLAWLVFYIAAPVWLGLRGRGLSAGLVQLIGAFMPGIWHGIFWPDEAGNFGLLMIMLVPLPLCVIAVALIVLIFRMGMWIVASFRGPTV